MPETLNTGERVKVDWQGAVKVSKAQTVLLGLEEARDEISAPLAASIRISSAYVELQSQLGEHWFSAVNARYDDNDRFGSKLTYRIAPTWVSSASGTRIELTTAFDALLTDHPMFFSRVDGHVAVVNSLALRIAGITRTTPDPPGGHM